ncbi:unnamed protein product [Paramecium octaurelia]|uniref:Uncharacterized protein n=1 Tax=Paramecium octaurelia TaxID=43137 RepID=A0A8S1W9W5_PAROT|nr:unnamed protein product [Paramecium octaurelia]
MEQSLLETIAKCLDFADLNAIDTLKLNTTLEKQDGLKHLEKQLEKR